LLAWAPALTAPGAEGARRRPWWHHGGMTALVMNGRLDELDGLNPTRALILQAY
jgi:hypothetical protein